MGYRRVGLVLAPLLLLAVSVEHSIGNVYPRTVTVGQTPVSVAVAAGERRVFVVNGGDDTVSMLDADSGALLRTIRVGVGPYSLAVNEPAHRVFVANPGDNTVSVLDARQGTLLREVQLHSTPNLLAVDGRSDRVFVTTTPAGISMLDGQSGALLRTVPLINEPTALIPAERAGRLFVATPNEVQLLDATTGLRVRSIQVGTYPMDMAVDERRGRMYIVNGGDGSLSVLDSSSGTVLHTVAGLHATAVAEDGGTGHVFVAGEAGSLSATGSSLSMLTGSTGRLLHAVPLDGSPVEVLVDRQANHILIDTGIAISVLDATTGVVLHTLAMKGARVTSNGMAVDERTGQVFVLNTYDPNAGQDDESLAARLHRWLPWLPLPTSSNPDRSGSVRIFDANS